MLIEIISGLIIGSLVTKSRKLAFIVGAIVGFILGFFIAPWYMSMRGMSADTGFVIIVSVVEGLVVGLISLAAAHGKIRKKAKEVDKEAIEKTFE